MLMRTREGFDVDPFNLQPTDIYIDDIAHALSMQCRFGGHCRTFYSVAQHSLAVAAAVHLFGQSSTQDELWGLLHDASEAYLVDIPRPLKRSREFASYRELETKVQDAICDRFKLRRCPPECVTRADEALLATEARDLMDNPGWILLEKPLDFTIVPVDWRTAKNNFLERFEDLFEGIGLHITLDQWKVAGGGLQLKLAKWCIHRGLIRGGMTQGITVSAQEVVASPTLLLCLRGKDLIEWIIEDGGSASLRCLNDIQTMRTAATVEQLWSEVLKRHEDDIPF